MRDFLPAEKTRREHVLGVIRGVYRAHGFDEIETPVMEDASRLHAGLGGDNEKLAFGVLKRGLSREDLQSAEQALDLADLGLRFDLTVPLARFYASHRAELPTVFRAIQIAPVWRAERPQKGRYRQFMQCDIDIMGEAGPLAEVELLAATLDALDALGLSDARIRINDRRLLVGMLRGFGFAEDEHDSVLITIDKLDKIQAAGVVAELRERGATAAAVNQLENFLRRPQTMEYVAFGERQIRRGLPGGADDRVVAELAAIGEAVDAARLAAGAEPLPDGASLLEFDPFLVRGMGYYTGPIFEVAHPSVGYSLGGGGRYDGMIGRFLGQDVPAAGFSLGFERLVDLVALREGEAQDAVAIVHDADAAPASLAVLKASLLAQGARVRLARRTKNTKPLLDQLAAEGFTRFAFASAETTPETLELRPLGAS
ncbi:histidine--tRNA ligase [Homoserinibacter sp. YIM 151385]|uniref:histidine--tRNA ligase n=1 Tax=Homoserinibacter sp. YIM 151385 TaxID=2985506 RepID=UPI0022F13A8E|nr:ATP phosphoribosyltransferase regulatory subunit [Homoserinibacter sp. YIM 151385]WBU39425.1 ATP phosphoribosyltransferase regulatory subunit [Homoserinibacter sp. YIM 151385]